jgi:predicted MFS family arabinose efflux permease
MVVPLIGLRFIDILGMAPESAAAAAGMVLTVTSIALALSHATVALVGGFGFSATLIAGCIAGAGAFLLLTLSADVGSTALAMVLIGLTLGQAGPANNAALSLVAGALAQGKAAGLSAAARNLGLAMGPLIGGLLYQRSIALPFHMAALMLVCAALLAMIGRRALARRGVI